MTRIFAEEANKYTTITISKDTAKKLKEFFGGEETYNYVLAFLLDYYDGKSYKL